jgi:hypothetical protein
MPIESESIEIENCLRDILKDEGYKLSSKTGLARLSSDIKAAKDGEVFYIEIAGSETSRLESTKEFYEAFFQAVSRLNNKDCKHCIIAMPESSRKLLPIRAKIFKVAWERISTVFPELQIWLVDVQNKQYQKTSWISWIEKKH